MHKFAPTSTQTLNTPEPRSNENNKFPHRSQLINIKCCEYTQRMILLGFPFHKSLESEMEEKQNERTNEK